MLAWLLISTLLGDAPAEIEKAQAFLVSTQ